MYIFVFYKDSPLAYDVLFVNLLGVGRGDCASYIAPC